MGRALRLAGVCAAFLVLGLQASSPARASFSFPANTPHQFAPRDDCAAVAGAAEFRRALSQASVRRDAAALAALAAPDVLLDHGGGAGRDELRRRLDGSDGIALWREIDGLLALGCAGSEGDLVMPWLVAQDLGDVDPYDVMVVTGKEVPMRSRPAGRARVRQLLSWQLVVIRGGYDPVAAFQRVAVVGGADGVRAAGYVASARLRSPLGYRVVARRAGPGQPWQIAALIAGD